LEKNKNQKSNSKSGWKIKTPWQNRNKCTILQSNKYEPYDNDLDIPIDTEIYAKFSEPMNINAINKIRQRPFGYFILTFFIFF
jgi:hypothetical protein